MKPPKVFIGIDQTGAALQKGVRAKPLPLAAIDEDEGSLRLTTAWIPSFTFEALQKALPMPINSCETAILIDCVFGLEEKVWRGLDTNIWSLFREAASDTAVRRGFGLAPAAEFFDELLRRSRVGDSFPVRRCERIAKANSVFRTRPYQKNIQCGTYRIWRDLGSSAKHWAQIRYFTPQQEVSSEKPWLFEAYPSLFWREILGLRTRKSSALANALKEVLPQLAISESQLTSVLKSPDLADAVVLAVGGFMLRDRLFTGSPSRTGWLHREGWIIGLPLENG